jgi:hypothetical protein
MAWIAMDVDKTLLHLDGSSTPGAAEAMQHLLDKGHRVSIWTARFAHAQNEQDTHRIHDDLVNELERNKIPYSDIWLGPVKPDVDVFVGDNLIPYEGSWPQALAMLDMYLGKPADGSHEVVEEK